jgi:uncharacterized Zn finger protein
MTEIIKVEVKGNYTFVYLECPYCGALNIAAYENIIDEQGVKKVECDECGEIHETEWNGKG